MSDASTAAKMIDMSPEAVTSEDISIPEVTMNDNASILELTEAVNLEDLNRKDREDYHALTGGGGATKKIIGLMGVSGGVGTSTLAIQMAYDILRQGGKKAPSVAVIDLDFEGGDCAAYLDLKAGLTHEDLRDAPDRIDIPLVAAYIARHKSGIHLLGTKNKLGGNDEVNADTILAILDTVCDMFDVVILDIPQIWRPWNHAAIGAADHFALITELSIPGIHKTRHKIEAIEKTVKEMAAPVEVIIAKMERRTFKNEIRLPEAIKILNRPLTGAFCIDGDTTLSARNRGVPAGAIRGDGRYARDARNVLDFWKKDERDFAQHIVK